jgi:hypothetical protein
MKKSITLLLWFLMIAFAAAQTSTKNDELKLEADYHVVLKEYSKALALYLRIIKSEPENADIKHRIGVCYLNSEDEKVKAIPYLEEAVEKVSEKYNPNSLKETNTSIDAYFSLGSAYRVNNELDKAIEAYTKYKEYLDPHDDYNLRVTDQYIQSCKLALEMQQHPIATVSKNLGGTVNNNQPNYHAVISGNGKTLIYTATGRQGYEIFSSTYADTAWTTPKNITSVLGTGKYMQTCDLSFDGLSLLLASDDPGNNDIFISRFNRNKWSKVSPLDKTINSKSNETHASFSPDCRTIYFTSDRKGGEGDLDVYVSELDKKGNWGKPVNMGKSINTPFNEETPFVTDDGKKLFFSSEGHAGIGGYDIFSIDLDKPDASAVNVGYPINTTDNNLFFRPVGDGLSAYYSYSGPESYGGRDIYLVNLPKPVTEEQVAEAVVLPEPLLVEQHETVVLQPLPEPKDSIVAVVDTLNLLMASEEPAVVAEPEPAVVTEPEPVVVSEPEPVAETAAEPVAETAAEPAAEAPEVIPEAPLAAEVGSPDVNRSYTIQIMALRKQVDMSYFSQLSDVILTYSQDKWYRYTYGCTRLASDAEKIRGGLIEKGFKDAFILQKHVYPHYTIQIMAVPGPVVDLAGFKGVTDISVTRASDKFCRYTTGEFKSKEEAQAALDGIKNAGYESAFIRKVEMP